MLLEVGKFRSKTVEVVRVINRRKEANFLKTSMHFTEDCNLVEMEKN